MLKHPGYSAVLLASLMLQACTTLQTSNPTRTATEELLISTAADRAAHRLASQLTTSGLVFVDSSFFEGTDSKQAIGAIRNSLLSQGVPLTSERSKADTIVEIRAGALSTDRQSFLVGIPSFSLPMPLSDSSITVPELALYGKNTQIGVASFSAVSYDARTGRYLDARSAQLGESHNDKISAAFVFSWTNNDTRPAAPPLLKD